MARTDRTTALSEDWERGYLQLETTEQARRKNWQRLKRSGFIRYLQPAMQVLDLCCGRGVTMKALAEYGAGVVGLDLSFSLLRIAQDAQCHHLVCADSSVLPFTANAFDAVVVQGGLHHLRSDQFERALDEIDRVLRPGGYFAFTEPANTWILRTYVALVDTPLAALTPYTRNWRKTLEDERETYFNWLRTQRHALDFLRSRMDVLWLHTGCVTLFGLARSRKPSRRSSTRCEPSPRTEG